jgi:MFS family permease
VRAGRSCASQPLALCGLGAAGAGVALVAPALFARAGRLADERGRGAAIASLTTFGYLGFVIGPIVVGLLSQAAGLRIAIGALGLVAVALAVGGSLTLGLRPRGGSFVDGGSSCTPAAADRASARPACDASDAQ